MSFPQGGQADVDRAVAAARQALERGWRQSTGSSASKLLLKVADLVRRDAEELALRRDPGDRQAHHPVPQ